jgi:hypothetical protein
MERCPEYGIGYGWYPVYSMGLCMTWKCTLGMDLDCGWFGKVSGVRFGKVPHVQIRIVDGLERFPENGLVDDC